MSIQYSLRMAKHGRRGLSFQGQSNIDAVFAMAVISEASA
jgi:hypothetical protein